MLVVYISFLQLLVQTFLASISMWLFTLNMCAETHVGLFVRWSLKLSDLNVILYGWTVFCQISLSSCYTNIEGRTDFNRRSSGILTCLKMVGVGG